VKHCDGLAQLGKKKGSLYHFAIGNTVTLSGKGRVAGRALRLLNEREKRTFFQSVKHFFGSKRKREPGTHPRKEKMQGRKKNLIYEGKGKKVGLLEKDRFLGGRRGGELRSG